MEPEEVADLIREGVPESDVEVFRPRDRDDDTHLAAVVVSPAFEDTPLVQQHQLVYDALGDHMTRDIHALELKTYTPEEYADVDG